MQSNPKFSRIRKDGTRETVIMPPTGAPVWIESEPEWHFWLTLIVFGGMVPLGAIAAIVWAVVNR